MSDVELVNEKINVNGKEYTSDEAAQLSHELDTAIRKVKTEKQGFVAEISEDGTYVKINAVGAEQIELLKRLAYMGIPKKK